MKKLFAFLIILVIVLTSDISQAINKNDTSQGLGNTNGNIASGGSIVQKDEWIYYVESEDGCSIYRMNEDGTIREKLVSGDCSYLNIVSDKIYYVNTEYGKNINKTINCASLDGADKQVLITLKSIFCFQMSDEWMYYSGYEEEQGFGLFKTNIHTGDTQILFDEWVDVFQIEDEWIYMNIMSLGYRGIYRIKNDGSGFSQIYSDFIHTFTVDNGYVYFYPQSMNYLGQLRRINVDGNNEIFIARLPGHIKYINVFNNYIYYMTYDTIGRIQLNDFNNNEIITTTDGTFYSFSVIRDYVYFTNGDALYSFDLLEENKNKILDSGFTDYVLDDEGAIYFTKDNNVYRIKNNKQSIIKEKVDFYINMSSIFDNNTIYSFYGGISKFDITKRKEQKIFESINSMGELTATDEFLYYTLHNDQGFPKLYRIKKDGSGNVLLTDKTVMQFLIHNDKLYYVSHEIGREDNNTNHFFALNIMDLNNLETIKLCDYTEPPSISYADSDEILLSVYESMYLLNISDNKTTKVDDDEYIQVILHNGSDKYFFGSGRGLYKTNNINDLNKDTLIVSSFISNGIDIFNDTIYYKKIELYRIGHDGTDKKLIDATSPIKMTDFSDVPAGYAHEASIKWAYDNNIIVGNNNIFSPDVSITEAQFVIMLTKFGQLSIDMDFLGDHFSDKFYKSLESKCLPLKGLEDSSQKDIPINRGRIAQIIAAVYGLDYTVDESIMFMYLNNFSVGMSKTEMTINTYGKEMEFTRAAATAFMQKMSITTQIKDLEGNVIKVEPREIMGLYSSK